MNSLQETMIVHLKPRAIKYKSPDGKNNKKIATTEMLAD